MISSWFGAAGNGSSPAPIFSAACSAVSLPWSLRITENRPQLQCQSVASICIDLIEHPDDLERDQHDDNELEAQRSAGVDDVGECVGGFRHHGQFPVEG